MKRTDPILTITGPTAVGKTDLSLELATRHDAEIISADSRQIYRHLDTGTAKPDVSVRTRIAHHFIDELDLDEPFSAGRFAREAWQRIDDIFRRGRVPLVVGGSTLYLYALHFGLADIPDVDDRVREAMEARLEREGAETLFSELQDVDPEAATTMDPTKTQRLVRALEVYHGTGRPLSYYHEQQPEPPFRFQTVVLNRDRSVLYDRINRRVDQMLDEGLMDEVQAILDAGYDDSNANALRTIGYREPIRHLRGELDYDEMVRLVKRKTRRYAKRQITWFRRFDSYVWIDPPFTPHRVPWAVARRDAGDGARDPDAP